MKSHLTAALCARYHDHGCMSRPKRGLRTDSRNGMADARSRMKRRNSMENPSLETVRNTTQVSPLSVLLSL